ncbi:MAG: hypothetical protein AAFN40_03450 [Cyanobacteria bacterium J06560_6]
MKTLIASGLLAAISVVGTAQSAFASPQYREVAAQSCWHHTQLYVNEGDTVSFRTEGRWSHGGETPQVVSPGGYVDTYHAHAISTSQPLASLIGRVENGRPFLVGSQSTLTMRSSGYLYLGMNDLMNSCEDNTGVLAVEIDHRAQANHSVSTTVQEISTVVEDVGSVIRGFENIFN